MSAAGELIGGRYRLQQRVGTGGMGTVWQATDERLHRSVAFKQLRPHPELTPAEADLANQRAMREARITARLQHRHAVTVFDVVEHEGRPCLVMQFLPSMTLAAVLKEGGPLAPAEAAQVGAQVASALAAAHAVGIVHRDVKPSNILIGDDGNALISDFGISRALGDSSLTATGLVHGTPAYLAPEVARGADSSYASDVFSLGSTLYAALEGEPPFGSDPNAMALLHRVASGDIPPLKVSGPLADTVLAMLSFDPADRPSMAAVAEMLRGLASPDRRPDPGLTPATVRLPVPPAARPDPVSVPPPPVPVSPAPTADRTIPSPLVEDSGGRPDRPGGRRRGVLAAVLLLVVAIVAATVWGLSNGAGPVAGDQPTGRASSARPATSAAPTPSASSSASMTPTPSDSRTSARATPSSTSPTPSSTPPTGTPTAAELAGAISSYYALVPDDLDAGWSRLTRTYQANPSGGRENYEEFWKDIDRVSVSRVTGNPPGTAQATVTYVYKSGNRVVRERTTYGLVEDHGVLKINTSRVLGPG